MNEKEFEDYEKYLKSMKKKDLVEHALLQMRALHFLQEEKEQLRLQAQASNARYLSHCRSFGGVTLPPGM